MQELLKQAHALQEGMKEQLQQFDRLIKNLPAPMQRELRTLMQHAKQGTLDATGLQRIARLNGLNIDKEIAATEAKKAATEATINSITNMVNNEPTSNQP